MIGTLFGANPASLLLALTILLLFGVAYNAFVAWMEKNKYEEGYVAFLVAVGVAITILVSAFIIGIEHAIIIILCFIASGAPMIVGSVWRHIQLRKGLGNYLKQIESDLKGLITK